MSRSSASRPMYVIGPRQTGAPVPMSGFGSAAPELGSPYASLNSSQSRRSTNDASDSSPGFPGACLMSRTPSVTSSSPPRRWNTYVHQGP